MFRGLFRKIDDLLASRRRSIDDELFDDLEELLVCADVSIHTAVRIVGELREAVRRDRIRDADEVREHLKQELVTLLMEGHRPLNQAPSPPAVYTFVGVNGVGKTTSIAKTAYMLKRQRKRVLLAAADTFRAAAIDQLEIWGQRVGVDVIRQKEGSDPAAVVYDAIQAARARHVDVVLVDTAGRLHTKANLMEELRKIHRVIERELGRPPDETLLVLDATTGQNAVSQARTFKEAVAVTGIVLSKLDGTAKGGNILTIQDELKIPIILIGTGEQLEDMEPFDPKAFVDALFTEEE
ncbi:MAG TPA: signal recognition particle-docking protein FtsY [Armatimonadetes bacterium]|jgi:fused signal recognition particle receptor|nr:signal recognition particle-docking protein FtsY [Armatimonadota bacterium]